VWADSFDTPLAHGATADDTEEQFLIARETDLDTGGVTAYTNLYVSRSSYDKNLNLADATFNGVALGGDAEDGAAFFSAGRANDGGYYSYAGILSGTNLGAPLTDTQGTAKWIGAFKQGISSPIDFVLTVSFGTGAGAGELEAVIQERYIFDYHLKGEFDDTGVITGTAVFGYYRTNNPANRGHSPTSLRGKLTGLIGEEGAVGAFLIGNSFGGFVARPPSAEELQTLEQTCADDPFNSRCNIGYESERIAVIEHCIIASNANDESCRSVQVLNRCIDNPFRGDCDDYLPGHYEQARANRLAFCRTAGNAGNRLCTDEFTFSHICRNFPFDAQCRGDNNYRTIRRTACTDNPFATRCAGDAYNDLRVSFCEGKVGIHPSCPAPEQTTIVGATPQVTASVWADSFEAPLARGATFDDTSGQF
ncbi:MAG: hypothetical protein K8953_13415, partial [Proteobacteria bacterium]|nr:hypothetical protein [Pseudomonadota bacterium]